MGRRELRLREPGWMSPPGSVWGGQVLGGDGVVGRFGVPEDVADPVPVAVLETLEAVDGAGEGSGVGGAWRDSEVLHFWTMLPNCSVSLWMECSEKPMVAVRAVARAM